MVRLVLVVPALFLVFSSLSPVFADTGSFPVVFGNTYQINYNANGVVIQDIEANPTYDELTVTVQVSSPNASLDLTIPRDLIDSKQGNNDISFIAVVDGTLADMQEKTPTATTRTVSLQLTPDNKQIEIIGTYMVTPGQNGGTTNNPVPKTTPTPQAYNNTLPAPVQSPYSGPKNSTTQQSPPETQKPQPNTTPENTLPGTNMTGNIVFTIPYLPNGTISLSPIDGAVIGAISIVVIIVIASTARKRK
ncbi:MAG: hypothetical protein KGH83_03775 [Thaumarchaeota archaeon]|nr:hypothetical protein [Nitrososphaerota archaeon]